jgi:N-acetylneuraminate lyase
LHADGSLNPEPVGAIVEHLLARGITGLYVCGSTGEGMSLSGEDRRAVTRAYVHATDRRVPVIVQVGHNSLHEARQLAAHAQEIGADVISATCPSYFKVSSVASLVDCMAELASGAPNLPFYYYHIPSLTGSKLDMVEFLNQAAERIPNLAGLKYTDSTLHEFQECVELQNGRFDVVWGFDEMLLGALATGATAGIGSTYNIAAPLYNRLMAAFAAGNMIEARRLQALSIKMIRIMNHYPFHPAMKAVLAMRGLNVGGCRLPQGRLSAADVQTLRTKLESIGFFEWSEPSQSP